MISLLPTIDEVYHQQFQVIQTLDLVKVYKLNDLVKNKIQRMRAAIFSRKRGKKGGLIKRKKGFIIFSLLPNSISLVDGLCYEIIKSSNLHFFFYLSQNVNHLQ